MLGTPTKWNAAAVFSGKRQGQRCDPRAGSRHARRGRDDSLNTEVAHVRQADGGFNVELTQGGTLKAKSVIVATGGVSYPTTGSTGDGYQFARKRSKRHETERVARGDDDG
ncbi:MAG: hypothetical protein ACLUI3_16195 [Christensenellales bacterium]